MRQLGLSNRITGLQTGICKPSAPSLRKLIATLQTQLSCFVTEPLCHSTPTSAWNQTCLPSDCICIYQRLTMHRHSSSLLWNEHAKRATRLELQPAPKQMLRFRRVLRPAKWTPLPISASEIRLTDSGSTPTRRAHMIQHVQGRLKTECR